MHVFLVQESLGLWKADIDSAFRWVPIRAEHREFAAVVFVVKGKVLISVHYSFPFGSIASVHGWDRLGRRLCFLVWPCFSTTCCACSCVGSLLKAIARKLLKLPLSRYCDDFFAADRQGSVQHAMQTFARYPSRVILPCCGSFTYAVAG